MIRAVPLMPEHYAALYQIALACEPFAEQLTPTLSHYRAAMQDFEGVALLDDERVVGSVLFNGLVPLVDVCLHAAVLPEFRRQWAIPSINRIVFSLPFVEWQLPRVSSYSIRGVTDAVERPLVHFGFREEGVKRRAALLPDGYHDLALFGMLKEDCPWI